jgi:hypothetical protein
MVIRENETDISAAFRGETSGGSLRMVIQFRHGMKNSLPRFYRDMFLPVNNQRNR